MKYGFYGDSDIPNVDTHRYPWNETKLNSHGYRCAEFTPLPDGGKNVVVLGCSHTFGQGLTYTETWVKQFESMLSNKNFRFWNLGQPGASADQIVRILHGSEKVLFASYIIVCWPDVSRRERLDRAPISQHGSDRLLEHENKQTDVNNFLKNFFLVEKFAEKNNAKVFHCFAQEVITHPDLGKANMLLDYTVKNCYPEWDKHGTRESITEPDLARDGNHYGPKHHHNFAKRLYSKFGSKLK